MVTIVRASPVHVGPIANRMRAIDRLEAGAFGHSPKQALRAGLMAGDTWTAITDRPVAMFGVVMVSALEGLGRPWLLGTDDVYREGRALLTIGKAMLPFDSMRRLENVVSSGNGKAIRLLGRWGFTVEREETMIGGTPFRLFWMER